MLKKILVSAALGLSFSLASIAANPISTVNSPDGTICAPKSRCDKKDKFSRWGSLDVH